MLFYNARWYDPVIGRFLAADTIVPEPGNPQSLNRYSYVHDEGCVFKPSVACHRRRQRLHIPPRHRRRMVEVASAAAGLGAKRSGVVGVG